ncbi:ATP synthase subunit I [Treponema sp. R8-4-B8]
MNLGLLGAGLILGIAAVGSGFGIGIASQAAIGAWKKCYLTNKPAPMTLLVFVGAPLTQVFYAYILMGTIRDNAATSGNYSLLNFGFSIASAVAIAFSAVFQGKAGACAADAQAESGKGFAQYVAAIGVIETVALFTMVLSMNSLL